MEQGHDFFCTVSQYLSFYPQPSFEPCGRRSVRNPKVYRIGEDSLQKTCGYGTSMDPNGSQIHCVEKVV